MKKGCQGHGAVLRQETMLKGLRMHPVGTLCCYLTGIALRRTFSLKGNSSGKLKRSGSNSSQQMSEWSIKQGARQSRPRYQEIMILDHIQDMKTLQGRGWLIIFLYLSYQFKISSESEILWDRLLEVCVAVYTRILWELSVEIKVGMRQVHIYILVKRTLCFWWDERT